MANSTFLSTFNYKMVKWAIFKRKISVWLVYSAILSLLILIVTRNLLFSLAWFLLTSFVLKEFYLPHPINKAFLSGFKGEQNCLVLLKKLPKGFTIFNQLEIPSEKSSFKEFETDFIVIGHNNLFIVEAKRYTGKISSNSLYSDWEKTEYYKNGNLKSKDIIKSPIKQILRQKDMLLDFLANYGLKLDIKTILYLNMDCENVDLPVNKAIPFFTDKTLITHIREVDKTTTSFIEGYKKEKLVEILVLLNEKSKLSRKNRLKDIKILKKYISTSRL